MKPLISSIALVLGTGTLLSACIPSSETQAVSTPTPSPVQTQTIAPEQVQAVQETRYGNYLDAPQTPGDWRYARSGNSTQASFAFGSTSHFSFACIPSSRQISLMRQYNGTGDRVIRIKTETAERTLTATPMSAQPNIIAANLSASDPFLDAMAITKGRIAVETNGMNTLYLPAWPELSRVIEDCR